MQNSLITNNIIYQSYKDKSILNILYKKTNSLIDFIFYSFENINFFDDQYINNYITNFDCFLSCDPMDHSTICAKYRHMHIKNMLYIMYDYPNFLKKEDKFLLKNQLQNTYKLIALDYLINSWEMADLNALLLGIPENKNTSGKKNKDILVLNIEKNNSITNLFRSISHSYPNTDMMTDINTIDNTIQNIYDLFGSYKIILSLNSLVNTLIALESGSHVITNNNYLSQDGAIFLEDINHLEEKIKLCIENKIDKQQNIPIHKKYDFKKFEINFTKHLSKIISEPFLYE